RLVARAPSFSGWSPARKEIALALARRRESEARALEALAFAPPEQLISPDPRRGRAGGADGDVYALGALLYVLLTGKPPYSGATGDEVVASVLRGAPARPRSLVSSVPRRLEQICLSCLAKDPAARPRSASELAALLRTRFEPTTSDGALAALA